MITKTKEGIDTNNPCFFDLLFQGQETYMCGSEPLETYVRIELSAVGVDEE